MKKVSESIKSLLLKNKNDTNRKSQTKYLKNVVDFYGIKSPELNALFKPLWKEEISKLESKDQINLGLELLSSKFFEEKYLSILILNKNIKKLSKDHIPTFEEALDKDIYDWATCDTFSSRVICEMMKKDQEIVKLVEKWKDAKSIWRQRSSCVSFVKIARHGTHKDTIINICETTVKNQESLFKNFKFLGFVQLGTGWVLREVSTNDLERVIEFIKENYESFSREGLRYAIEKMDSKTRLNLLNYKKDGNSTKRKKE